MVDKLVILGSTGSIGLQALEVCDNLGIRIEGLAAGSNISLLEKQARKYRPAMVSVMNPDKGRELKIRLSDTPTRVVYGLEGMLEIVTASPVETVLTSVVGIAGLLPTMQAISAGKNIALANKETLVTAGKLVMEAAKEKGVQVLPVDSEHSAIFQSLSGNRPEDVEKLILTASGGPFRGFTQAQLRDVTLKQALKHPNWSMGNKITIDSATMMNKGLEIIEAQWLFHVGLSQIEVLIHPQSIIHSMVSYIDGSTIAQLGFPDMRVPIQLALTWPERVQSNFQRADFHQIKALTFDKPDLKTFRCLALAYRAADIGGSLPAVMNAANEVAVSLFLREEISFVGIMDLIESVMDHHTVIPEPDMEDIIKTDRWGREETLRYFENHKNQL